MSVFSEKLDQLQATVMRAAGQSVERLAMAMNETGGFATVVGSGGSAVTCAYLAACRRTLGQGPTWVTTPAEFVLTGETALGQPIWLLSGSGENSDILAAFERARAMSAPNVHVLTSRADSQLACRAAAAGASVHLADCGAEKDGFLATHTLAAALTALLGAADVAAAGTPSDPVARLASALASVLGAEARAQLHEAFVSLTPHDVLFVLYDPRLAPAAIALETSAWEAGLCPVQRVDFRNFAHGRHVWAGRWPEKVFVLALTSNETRPMWAEITDRLPPEIRRLELDGGGCGRLETAVSVFSALAVVEGMGAALGVDPARPGVSDFGRALFDSASLSDVVARLSPPLRAKRLAVHRYDAENAARDLAEAHAQVRALWADAEVKGVVLDYDGTLVTTEDREAPLGQDLSDLLQERMAQGLRVAIATGRGGSAGERLREVLPPAIHGDILVGYYNGALLRALDIDIREEARTPAPAIAKALAWLGEVGTIPPDSVKNSFVQLTIPRAQAPDLAAFDAALRAAGHTDLRLVQSGHTVDICLASTCKTVVVNALAERWGFNERHILRVGDSGGPQGNDHALLASEMGISVGELCGRAFHGWPMFGATVTGPEAVLRLLKALRFQPEGWFQIDLDALEAIA
jgi:hydroxymethylpyrimidine pyrophosphatase-like HAD family hydrolase/D-arabinose 5-phosphate isomerase GutQ